MKVIGSWGYANSDDGSWGYVAQSGQMVIKPQLKNVPPEAGDCEPFSEGFACIKINGKIGYIDKSGSTIVSHYLPPPPDSQTELRLQLLAVGKGGATLTRPQSISGKQPSNPIADTMPQSHNLAALSLLACLSLLTSVGCGNGRPSSPAANNSTVNKPPLHGQPDYRQVENTTREIVAKILGIKPNEVEVNTPLSEQKVAADELDEVEIVMGVEEAFGVDIRDEEVTGPGGESKGYLSVKKLAEIVLSKKKAAELK